MPLKKDKTTDKYKSLKEAESKAAKGGVGGGAAAMAQRKAAVTRPHCKLCGPHKQFVSAKHMQDHYGAHHSREPFDMEAMTAVFAKAKTDLAATKFQSRGGDTGKIKPGGSNKKKAGESDTRSSRKGKGNTDQLPVELLAAMAGMPPARKAKKKFT